ncbi:hypothetical protein SLS62_011238 [Diatrype stigma]|uniref:2EXR domain-containing protein n=1 Tax=Diatrype stigma TaxID=117547 RepID=A0AAN9U4U5_9PEZI
MSTGHPSSQGGRFELMKRLPPELRLQIYEAHLSEAQVFEMEFGSRCSRRFETPTFRCQIPKEPLLQTCREARQVALRNGFFLFGEEDRPGVYLRKSDILFLNMESLIHFGDIYHRLSSGERDRKAFAILESLGQVENLAVEWGSVVSSQGLRGISPGLGEWVTGVRTVSLVIPHIRLGTRTSAAEPLFLKNYPAELRPITDACVLPDYTKQDEDDPTKGEIWDTCGQTLTKKVLGALHGGHSIDVEACFLHRNLRRDRFPKFSLSVGEWLVYDDGALSQRRVNTATINDILSSSEIDKPPTADLLTWR